VVRDEERCGAGRGVAGGVEGEQRGGAGAGGGGETERVKAGEGLAQGGVAALGREAVDLDRAKAGRGGLDLRRERKGGGEQTGARLGLGVGARREQAQIFAASEGLGGSLAGAHTERVRGVGAGEEARGA